MKQNRPTTIKRTQALKRPRDFEGTSLANHCDSREIMIKKWIPLADKTAEPEAARFQILVAVLLSAQAQPMIVQRALQVLKEMEGGLSAESIAQMEEEKLAKAIHFVHFNKAKARHLHQTARKIKQLRGRVPHSLHQYVQLPGIGEKMGKLLVVVNNPTLFAAYPIKKQPATATKIDTETNAGPA
jgi:endonuclease III